MKLFFGLFLAVACTPDASTGPGAEPDVPGDVDTDASDSDTDSTDDTDADTEGDPDDDTGLPSDGIENINPSYGSGGGWAAGATGRTPLGADIRIPTTYAPDRMASPVIFLFNEQISEWTHTDDEGVILVDLREYNDVPAIIEKLNESMALLQEEYNVDQGRYYFAGWSAGGNISVVLSSMNQSLVAGTMVFPGTGGNQAKAEMQKTQAHKIRLFYACGDKDPAYPWDKVEIEANFWKSAFGYETKFVRVEGGPHKLAESQYGIREDAWEWMQQFNMEN